MRQRRPWCPRWCLGHPQLYNKCALKELQEHLCEGQGGPPAPTLVARPYHGSGGGDLKRHKALCYLNL